MDFVQFQAALTREFPQLGASQIEKFQAMEPLYRDWNSKINVISRKDIDGLYLHHVWHSLAIAAYLKSMRSDINMDGATVLDLGTGGGFPGIPLAVMFPNTRFTLCDSVGKKIIVASEVAKSLNLNNVTTVNARAEQLKEKFGYVVSRAVSSLDNFYPWVKGRFSGSILYLKGGDVAEETAILMAKYRLPRGSVSTWNIEPWGGDEYFEGKYVIDIRA